MNASNTWLRKPRKPIGEKKREMVQRELGLYPTWEELLNLHRIDYWHCTVAQASQPGWPDYTLMGDGWLAFVELKATTPTGRRPDLSVEQKRYRASLEAAGAEYKTFCLPDDWNEVDDWLIGHTGREIRGVWKTGVKR